MDIQELAEKYAIELFDIVTDRKYVPSEDIANLTDSELLEALGADHEQ